MHEETVNSTATREIAMQEANITVTEANPVTIFVPLFRDGKKPVGVRIRIFERFGAWSFTMESDLAEYTSLIDELFNGLCRVDGLRRRLVCAVDLEIGRRDNDQEFLYEPYRALAAGDYFTFDAILHLVATAFVPYWRLAARKISRFDRGKGWEDTCQCAIKALDNWREFDRAEIADSKWERAWRNANCRAERMELIRGDNWRVPAEEQTQE